MSDEGAICYMGSMKGKSVIYVPDEVEVPEEIKKESFTLMAGHGTLYTIRDKQAPKDNCRPYESKRT